MAAADIKALRDKAQAERDALEKQHAELQKKHAGDKANAGVAAELRAVKQKLAMKNEEHGEFARMVALQAGGKNYKPPV